MSIQPGGASLLPFPKAKERQAVEMTTDDGLFVFIYRPVAFYFDLLAI